MQEPADTAQPRSHRPLVIPVFIPNAGCPHRCIFCNQVTVTGQAAEPPSADALHDQIGLFLSHRIRDRRPVEIAFYGGNFLGLETGALKRLLVEASRYVEGGKADGIRFSTRPDTVNCETLELLKQYPVTTVEIGAQSMVDSVLRRSTRGHSAADTTRAVKLLKSAEYQTGLQLMLGLPTETRTDLAVSGHATVKLAPDFARIYPTLVLAGSALARRYRQHRFFPIDLDEAVWRAKTLYRQFYAAGIRIVRMGLQASIDLQQPTQVMAGPFHPAFGHLVFSALFFDAACATIASAGLKERHVQLRINPRSESKLRGLKNQNMVALRQRFDLLSLTVNTDTQLSPNQIGFNGLSIDVMTVADRLAHPNSAI